MTTTSQSEMNTNSRGLDSTADVLPLSGGNNSPLTPESNNENGVQKNVTTMGLISTQRGERDTDKL